MKRIIFASSFLIGIALSLQACTAKPSPQQSCDFVQNSDQQRVSWGSQVPVVLWVDSSVPSEFYDAIQAAAKSWNDDVGHEIIHIGGWINTNGTPALDGSNVIYFLKTWEANRNLEQARTTVYWAGNRIYEADVRVNGLNFDFSSGDTPIVNRVDFQSLMLHEFGHVLGLIHTDETESVMVKSLASDHLRRALSSFDDNSIRCEY